MTNQHPLLDFGEEFVASRPASGLPPLASTKRSVYMALPFGDFQRVMDAKRSQGSKKYTRWVIRHVISNFETYVRAKNRRGEIVDIDEELTLVTFGFADGLQGLLRRYFMAEADIPLSAELIRLKLTLRYLYPDREAQGV